MTNPIDAANPAIWEAMKAYCAVEPRIPVSAKQAADRYERMQAAIAAYRDSEIEALRAKLADCQAVIRHKGHDVDCPASSSACAICGLHELLHPCVTYFGDSQKHNFNRGPCSDACGHDRTTGEKA